MFERYSLEKTTPAETTADPGTTITPAPDTTGTTTPATSTSDPDTTATAPVPDLPATTTDTPAISPDAVPDDVDRI